MKDLRQLTSDVIVMGPFVLSSCVTTPSTGVTLVSTGAHIMKRAGSSFVAITSGSNGIDWAHITSAAGMYKLTVSSSWTDITGDLNILITSTTCLPVFKECRVLPQNIFDVYYCTTASAYPVDLGSHMSVDVNRIQQSTSAADNLTNFTSHTSEIISGNDGMIMLSTDNDFIGSDSQALISVDAQDLSGSLKVDMNAINGDTCDASNFQTWLNNTIGTDNLTLISADNQDLAGSLHVNAAAISGDTCDANNFQNWLDNTIGTDNKTLISADAQDLSGSLQVDTNRIAGSTSAADCLTRFTSHTTDIISDNDNLLKVSSDMGFIEDNNGVIVGSVLGDTSTAQDLVDGSSNLDAAISSRSSHDSTDVWALASSYGGLTYNQLFFRTYSLLNEIMEVSDASGQAAIVRGGADIATATLTDDGTTTTRTQWTWAADT